MTCNLKDYCDKAWSRRIDEVNRLVYHIDENGSLWIVSCRGHYED
ncbi:MAG: type II toxin-antitoxin system YoeB family toxin [Lachnospiraceae bacterium]